jgi:predicted acyltransferase
MPSGTGLPLPIWCFQHFLFVVGNAMSFSQAKYEAAGEGSFIEESS